MHIIQSPRQAEKVADAVAIGIHVGPDGSGWCAAVRLRLKAAFVPTALASGRAYALVLARKGCSGRSDKLIHFPLC
jgi:hypothetical protein